MIGKREIGQEIRKEGSGGDGFLKWIIVKDINN